MNMSGARMTGESFARRSFSTRPEAPRSRLVAMDSLKLTAAYIYSTPVILSIYFSLLYSPLGPHHPSLLSRDSGRESF